MSQEPTSNPTIRIFVTTHKPVEVPEAATLRLVQVGWHPGAERLANALHDDEGESIAERNPMYCELTSQYWAWKNTHADYVGFCHYRRYFNCSGVRYEENPFGEVIDDYIDDDAVRRYGLDDDSIRSMVEGFDLITTPVQSIPDMPGEPLTPFEQYAAAPHLHIEDLERVTRIVARLHPDYADDMVAFLDGHEACFCNMFIMRWELFDAYCSWLFPILDVFVSEADMRHYSKEGLRTPGHLAERLLNVWIAHLRRTEGVLRMRELQCVHFTNPEREVELEALARTDVTKQVVPIVFAADDAYAPMLTTTLVSLLENASPDRVYDLVVFERGITEQRKRAMLTCVASYDNASLRFFSVGRLVAGFDLKTNNEHITLETYYRFLIQEVLDVYDKVLYLDSDLIIEGDVAELFDVDVTGAYLAAAPDIDFQGKLNAPDGERMAYAQEVLRLTEPYDYFQAGVLVLNTAELRRLHSAEEWLQIATTVDYLYDDQDILNAECQGRVVRLAPEWNVMHDCTGRVASVFSYAPADAFDAYVASRSNPKIIHFAGNEKPWDNTSCDFAGSYWAYARMTPFYEVLLSCAARYEAIKLSERHEKAISEDSPLRNIVDPLAPLGTRRREWLKAIGRAVQGKR